MKSIDPNALSRGRVACLARRCLAWVLAGSALLALAQGSGEYQKFHRNPDIANAAYGPDARNILDLWQAPSAKPTPLVFYIHGGGFNSGSKDRLSPVLLRLCLDAGISVGAINYRLTKTAPFPAAMHDGARAVQFYRHQARAWNLNPRAIGATGGSAGGTLSLWLAFHDDFAEPTATDPVRRHSTRLAAVAIQTAPTTMDPRAMETIAGPLASRHPILEPFFGAKISEWETPAVIRLFEDSSPYTHLTKDDPSPFLYYSGPWKLPANPNAGQAIHATAFGTYLREKADRIGVPVTFKQGDDYDRSKWEELLYRDMVAYFKVRFASGKP